MQQEEIFRQGLAYLQQEEWKIAVEMFSKVLNVNSLHTEAWYHRGLTYFKMKQYKEALADFDQAVLLQPQNPFRYASRAYVRSQIGDAHGAVEDYQKALDLDPEDAITLNNLGLLEEQLGYKQSAEARFQKADALADAGKTFEKPDLDEILRKHQAVEEAKAEFKNLEKNASAQPVASLGQVIGQVFTRKETFQEFWHFVKSKLGLSNSTKQ
ncbi:MAG TPA: hypothetical protein DCM08_10210 [Microscillaceae bacterium]|jgi:tetratricopeptide (TPR) repeat protein|nr:hypothetical protein [Microscillaceae bacterium]